MPSPLLFFIFIIVVDLLLKSARDKKKIEESKGKREVQQSKPEKKPGPFADLRRILEEEIQKERQRELEKKAVYKVEVEPLRVDKRPEVNFESRVQTKKLVESPVYEKDSSPKGKSQLANMDFRDSIVRGIIFSEILSEPKGVKNQRRSL
ncbi:MAG: hypothetical protein WCZ27_06015 [Tissierellaceae bacterium]